MSVLGDDIRYMFLFSCNPSINFHIDVTDFSPDQRLLRKETKSVNGGILSRKGTRV